MDALRGKVEVLRVDGRGEGADRLAGCAPQSREHIDGEGQRTQSQHDGRYRHRFLLRGVVRELEPADEVKAQQTEEHDPDGQEGLTVEDVPAVSEVGHREEFQRERQFDEAQDHLDHVHP